jgi:hypothetical protein
MSERPHGERIASLEKGFEGMVDRLNHLDVCLDEAKVQSAENFVAIQKKLSTWDNRWKYAIGVIVGAVLVAGSGTVSLQNLLHWIASFAK